MNEREFSPSLGLPGAVPFDDLRIEGSIPAGHTVNLLAYPAQHVQRVVHVERIAVETGDVSALQVLSLLVGNREQLPGAVSLPSVVATLPPLDVCGIGEYINFKLYNSGEETVECRLRLEGVERCLNERKS